jgi:hypothetical protein
MTKRMTIGIDHPPGRLVGWEIVVSRAGMEWGRRGKV